MKIRNTIRKLTDEEKELCREVAQIDGVKPKEIERLFIESGVFDLGVLPTYKENE